MTKEEFNQYTHNYYQSGSPQKAPEALLHFLSEELEEKTVAGTELILYFFGRIAQRDACIVREYERLLDARLASKGVSVLLQLLQRVGDLHTRDLLKSHLGDRRYQANWGEIFRVLDSNFPLFQNALLRPIRDGLDLDLLWMEFLVTGNRDAVVRIIEVLEWPDLLRGRLQQWLVFTTMRGPLSWRERRRVLALRDAAGLSIDLDQGKITTPEDLDCRCFLQGVQTNPERAKRLRKLLPFSLSEEELLHWGVKGTAKWSLWSNAAQHLAVMEVCVEETRSTSLRARLSLLEIQAEAHLSNWDADAAEEVLKEYVGLNPGNQDMVRRLEEAEVGEISFPSSKGKPPILARPALYVFLLGALVSIQFGHRVVPGFFEIVEASRAWTIGSALVSFLVAALVGALCQIFNCLLDRALRLETTEGPVYLGDIPPQFWFSPVVRVVTWLFVGALSAWSSGIASAYILSDGPGILYAEFGVVFSLAMLLRWSLATTLRILALPSSH